MLVYFYPLLGVFRPQASCCWRCSSGPRPTRLSSSRRSCFAGSRALWWSRTPPSWSPRSGSSGRSPHRRPRSTSTSCSPGYVRFPRFRPVLRNLSAGLMLELGLTGSTLSPRVLCCPCCNRAVTITALPMYIRFPMGLRAETSQFSGATP